MKNESELSKLKLHYEDLPETINWNRHLGAIKRLATIRIKKLRLAMTNTALSQFVIAD